MVEKGRRAREIAEREVTLDFWQGKTPCWEMCHCPEVIKSECPAPKYPSFPCWEIEGTYCKLTTDGTSGRDISICQVCRVHKQWGQNEPIELKLFSRGVDSFRRSLEQSAEIRAEHEPEGQVFPNTLRRRQEMYLSKLDEIIDKHNSDGKALTEILRDVQDEYDWLPVEALDHISKRLGLPSTKVYRAAIFSKGLSVLPRDHHRVDKNICIVDLLKYYLDFLQHDLCGKCLPCREGMKRMYQIVSNITNGESKDGDIELLDEVAGWVAELSACNLGTIAANIVLTTLSDFQDLFEAHLKGKGCPAGVCTQR